jgi:hypothetical protein
MNENPATNLSDNRKSELSTKVKAMMERYERSFGVRISSGEVLAIIDDMFEDNRKNFVKSQLGPITFADRDYLTLLFKTKKAVEDVEREHEEGKTERETENLLNKVQPGPASSKRGSHKS